MTRSCSDQVHRSLTLAPRYAENGKALAGAG